ncbi:hypothetical protein ACO0QE_001774 [Hanseniaspora vineae]
MPETIAIIIDNSEYSRNGDFPVTRYQQEIDAVNYIVRNKRNSNIENKLAIIAGAGEAPHVLLPNAEPNAILHEPLTVGGSLQVNTSIQIGQLIKPNQIILFICSPIVFQNAEVEKQNLVKLVKKLKKNNISLDIVNFGETHHNTSFLEELLENCEGSLLTVSPGPKLLYEHLATSAILGGPGEEFASGGDVGFQGGDDFMDFGVDPSMDPELAMALRMSMEEEQARQDRLRQDQEQQQQPEGDKQTQESTGNNDSSAPK